MKNTCVEKISVIIPTKNRPLFLLKAVESILQQSYGNIEIIVIDDGSTPAIKLADICNTSSGVAVKLIRNDISVGGAKSRNIGIDNCQGSLICFLDDDDIILENKFESLVGAMLDHPEAGMVFGKTLLNDGVRKRYPLKYPDKFSIDLNFSLGNYIHTSGTLIKREALSNVRFNECLTRYQDTQFHLEISLNSIIVFVDQDVSEWRVDGRDDQVTSGNSPEKRRNARLAFKELSDYFINKKKVSRKNSQYFIYYNLILQLKSGEYEVKEIVKRMLMNPYVLYASLLVFIKRKWFF